MVERNPRGRVRREYQAAGVFACTRARRRMKRWWWRRDGVLVAGGGGSGGRDGGGSDGGGSVSRRRESFAEKRAECENAGRARRAEWRKRIRARAVSGRAGGRGGGGTGVSGAEGENESEFGASPEDGNAVRARFSSPVPAKRPTGLERELLSCTRLHTRGKRVCPGSVRGVTTGWGCL